MGPRRLATLTAFLLAILSCALPHSRNSPRPSIWARSHNRSDVDVYLLCGDRNARRLGVAHPGEPVSFKFPYPDTRCVSGLNFFVVVRDADHGYWVGPMHPAAWSRIDLVIEKYAGLSFANVGIE